MGDNKTYNKIMKVEFSKKESAVQCVEIFEHGCFTMETINLPYVVKDQEWVKNEDGSFTRVVRKIETIFPNYRDLMEIPKEAFSK